jgi:molybdopterin-guanine dinucleotide biosynthesis protein A
LHKTLATTEADAALLTDDAGRLQPLTAVYRASTLRRALSGLGDPRDRSLRSLLTHLRIATLPGSRAAEDIDTAEDLARWTEHRARRPDPEPTATPVEDDAARKDHQGR